MMSRKLTAHLDFGFIMTLALCLFAVWPLVIHNGLMQGTDTLLHAYRAAEMSRSWAHGVLLPDWAESFYFGYGSPVFHYYASLTYYLTSFFETVLGLTTISSLRVLLMLLFFSMGGGMYLFLREMAGKLAGIIAAVVYVYSPYLVYTEPYARGDFPELLALSVFPLVMWRFARLLRHGGGWGVILAAVSVGLLALTHNLMAVVCFGLLVAWLGWHALIEFASRRGGSETRPYNDGSGGDGRSVPHPFIDDPENNHPAGPHTNLQNDSRSWRRYMLAIGVAVLGIGLTSFFWLPVLLENDAVALENLTGNPEYTPAHGFVSLIRLLSASTPVDIGATNGFYLRMNIGVAAWSLAVTGFLGVIFAGALRESPLRWQFIRQVAFFAVAAVGMLFLITPHSAGIWAMLHGLSLLQFPWRLLGPLAFCMAVLAGMNAVWINRLPVRWAICIIAGMIALAIALAFPTLYIPNEDGADVPTTVAAFQQAEVSGATSFGTTASNEFLPQAVQAIPGATEYILNAYAAHYAPGGDRLVNKVNPLSLPDKATLTVLEHGPQHDVWRIASDTPFTLEVFTFDFPGWTARIDGEPVAVTPTEPHGFIRIPVPQGAHTIRLDLRSTPARDLGRWMAAISAAILVGMAWRLRIRRRNAGGDASGDLASRPSHDDSGGGRRSVLRPYSGDFRAWWGGLAGMALAMLLAVLFMREGLAWVKSPPGQAVVATHPTAYYLGDRLQIIGYDLSADNAGPGDQLHLVIYWYASARPLYNYASFVHVSQDGPPVAQADKAFAGELPTTQWALDGYRRDEYLIFLPDTMPPGEYTLRAGLFTCETRPLGECGNGDRLPVRDAAGNALGDSAPLGTIHVR